jgi:hypothetical protein
MVGPATPGASTRDPSRGDPLGRGDALALLLVVAGAALSLLWLAHPWFDAQNDAAIYLMTAKSLARGEGYTYLGAPFRIRPPGFSLLLAPLVGAKGYDFRAVNLYVGAFGVLALGLLFLWTRNRIGRGLAALLCLCVWLNPGWRTCCNQAMSDVPGAACLVGCLLLERRARKRPSFGRDVVLGLAVGLSAYVRAGLLLLAPAIVVQRIVARIRREEAVGIRRILLPALVAVLALLPWKIREAVSRPAAPADQTSLYDYSTAMWHVDRGDPSSPRVPASEVLARVPTRLEETLSVLGSRLRERAGSTSDLVIGGAALAVALIFLLKGNRVEAWFLLATIAVLLVYFDFRDRLVLPIHLLVLPALVEVVLAAGRRRRNVGGPGGLRALRAERAARAVAALSLLVLTAVDFDPRPSWERIEREHLAMQATCASLAPHLPEEARLAAPFASWRWSIYLDRPVYTLFFGWARRGDFAGAEAVLDEYRIDRVLVSSATDVDARMRAYFEARYGVESRVEDVAVVRVR